MAKLKLKKYPKKPKASASVAAKENYLRRVREIDAENAAITRENQRSVQLSKQIASLRPGKAKVSGIRKKRSTPRKKATSKKRKR